MVFTDSLTCTWYYAEGFKWIISSNEVKSYHQAYLADEQTEAKQVM
jgi:hypothetical protein